MASKKQRERYKKILAQLESDGYAYPVSPITVYSDIFRLGSNIIQTKEQAEANKNKKYGDKDLVANPIAYCCNYKKDDKGKPIRHINKDGSKGYDYERENGVHIVMYDDTFEEQLKEVQQYDFAILSCCGYLGKHNYLKTANKIFALPLDFDGFSDVQFYRFLYGCDCGIYPKPNYIVLSGSNAHLYYIFEEPVPLYPDTKTILHTLKNNLIDAIWNGFTSAEKSQKQGITQGFRVIGGKTKPNSPVARTKAFWLHDIPWDLKTLNEFTDNDNRIDDTELFRTDKIPFSKAKQLYPAWAKKIEERKKYGKSYPDRTFTPNQKLYYWWLKKLQQKNSPYGSRYFGVLALVIFAVKCDIDFETVEKDAYDLIPILTEIKPDMPFTEDDVKYALSKFDEDYCSFPRATIEKMTHIPIPPARRNGRTQAQHIKYMNFVRDELLHLKEWRNKEGRPKNSGTYEQEIKDYISENPKATPTEIAKALCISKPTVYKFLTPEQLKGYQGKEAIIKDYKTSHPEATPSEIAKELGISRTTVYKYLKNT